MPELVLYGIRLLAQASLGKLSTNESGPVCCTVLLSYLRSNPAVALDREQKLFLEASDWEAKFYQIQSKYLLLLNELHNPQVMVSASRQEMVGLLLKDIVDNSEKPTLNSDTPEHDRFGFRFEEGASLIEKAERLQRIAEENLAETELSLEEVETRWQDVVLGLTRPGHFVVNRETKELIRRGVPINQRGTVWRAIIMNRIRGSLDTQHHQYYQVMSVSVCVCHGT